MPIRDLTVRRLRDVARAHGHWVFERGLEVFSIVVCSDHGGAHEALENLHQLRESLSSGRRVSYSIFFVSYVSHEWVVRTRTRAEGLDFGHNGRTTSTWSGSFEARRTLQPSYYVGQIEQLGMRIVGLRPGADDGVRISTQVDARVAGHPELASTADLQLGLFDLRNRPPRLAP